MHARRVLLVEMLCFWIVRRRSERNQVLIFLVSENLEKGIGLTETDHKEIEMRKVARELGKNIGEVSLQQMGT